MPCSEPRSHGRLPPALPASPPASVITESSSLTECNTRSKRLSHWCLLAHFGLSGRFAHSKSWPQHSLVGYLGVSLYYIVVSSLSLSSSNRKSGVTLSDLPDQPRSQVSTFLPLVTWPPFYRAWRSAFPLLYQLLMIGDFHPNC